MSLTKEELLVMADVADSWTGTGYWWYRDDSPIGSLAKRANVRLELVKEYG